MTQKSNELDNLDRVTPVLPQQSGSLNDNRCNGSNTEAGVLVAITNYVPTLPKGGTYYYRWGLTRPPSIILYPQEKQEPAYLSGGFSSTNSWCLLGSGELDKRNLVFFLAPFYICVRFWMKTFNNKINADSICFLYDENKLKSHHITSTRKVDTSFSHP
ncbi:hypothetical protein AVEN_182042-1 [Araneus ventricosus]|uniref:Uncharacterized protein n=1 Tax=Araneus ventricosus TaxID=182803 RepID=A0A4Y2K614_ARAVE|nr:hypothetical protein AVEN_182042-1 [Araneus ventricosus]